MYKIKDLMEKAVKFHGHACPGLAIGVLVSKFILENVDLSSPSPDEELVAVVENDNCSIDALQALLGTTFGKGNLIHFDYGKNIYTIYNRNKHKAIKLSVKPSSFKDRELSREERIEKLLKSTPEDIFKIEDQEFKPPEYAKIHESIICEACGEPTMSIRTKYFQKRKLCIPCFNKLKNDLI